MATKSRSAFDSFAARITWRPMRPNPLMPTFNVIGKLASGGLGIFWCRGSPVAARAGPAESHVTDRARAGNEERRGACVQRGAGRQHIVHQHEVQSAHALARAVRTTGHFKRVTNIRGTFSGSQPRLCGGRARADECVTPDGNSPLRREGFGYEGGLVVSPFTLARG